MGRCTDLSPRDPTMTIWMRLLKLLTLGAMGRGRADCQSNLKRRAKALLSVESLESRLAPTASGWVDSIGTLADTTPGTSSVVPLTGAVPAGNTVIVTVAMPDSSSDAVTVLDSQNNTYTSSV